MAASKKDSKRYEREVSNPWGGLDLGGALGSILSKVVAPELNPFNIRERQLQVAQAGVNAAKTDPNVVFDAPAAMGEMSKDLPAMGNLLRSAGRQANNLNPVSNMVNGLIDTTTAAGTALGFNRAQAAVPQPQAVAPAANPFAPQTQDSGSWYGGAQPRGPMDVESLRKHFIAQESGGNYAAVNASTGALGAYQVMPTTGQTLAKRLGLPWRPELMQDTSPAGRAYQDAIGGAAIKEAADYGQGDISKTAMYYHGGSNTKGWGPKTQQYARDMQARVGGGGGAGGIPGAMNPFDAASPYIDKTINSIRSATAAAAQPWSMNVQMPDAPKMPGLPDQPKRDFSETDRMMEAMRPVFMDESRQKKIVQGQTWQAAAQALMATPENAHWGKVLANVGAGLLSGKISGEKEVQSRYDAFEEKMYAYDRMNFQYESGKGDALYNEAVNDAEKVYQHNMTQWQADMRQFDKMNSVDMGPDGSVIVRSKTPGGMLVQVNPNVPSILSKGAMAEANVWQGAGQQAQQGANVVAGMNNQIVMQGVLTDMQDARAAKAEAQYAQSATAGAGLWSKELVRTGIAADILGPEVWDKATSTVRERVMKQFPNPASDEYNEAMNAQLEAMVTTQMLADPAFRQRAAKEMPTLMETYRLRQREDQKRTVTRDSRGRTTVREEMPF